MGIVWLERYHGRHAKLRIRRKVTEGKMRNLDFSENPIRSHVNFGPQNDPLIAIQALWTPECRAMGSLAMLVPKKKKSY